jgi:hypothetical protein
MIRSKQKGFAAIEISLVVVIIILIGAVVYLFIQNNQSESSLSINSPEKPKPQRDSPAEKTAAVSKAPALDNTSLRTMLESVYTTNIPTDNIEQYMTKKYADFYKKEFINASGPVVSNPIYCVQNSPNEVNFTNIEIAGSSASAQVNMLFGGGTVERLSLTIVDENGPKIDSVKSIDSPNCKSPY